MTRFGALSITAQGFFGLLAMLTVTGAAYLLVSFCVVRMKGLLLCAAARDRRFMQLSCIQHPAGLSRKNRG